MPMSGLSIYFIVAFPLKATVKVEGLDEGVGDRKWPKEGLIGVMHARQTKTGLNVSTFDMGGSQWYIASGHRNSRR